MLRDKKYYNVQEYIDSVEGTMNIYNMNFKSSLPLNDLLIDLFKATLEKHIVILTLTENEVQRYKGIGTKRLSRDLYGSTDMYYVINNLNNIVHPADVLSSGNELFILSNTGIKQLQKYFNLYR